MTDTAKIAIVTGGGGGIGEAVALALAEKGIKIAVADVRPATQEELGHGHVHGPGGAL